LHEQGVVRLAETQGLSNQWPQALKTYQQFLQSYPQSEFVNKAKFGLGWAYENMKQYAQATAAYTKLIDEGSKDESTARSQLQLGECYFNQQKYKEAIPEYLKVRINFNYPNLSSVALLSMGNALELTKQPLEAKQTYEELIRDFPDSTSATVAKQKLPKIVIPSN
jgi:TolA-binding protein